MKNLEIDEFTGLVLEGGGMRGVFLCSVPFPTVTLAMSLCSPVIVVIGKTRKIFAFRHSYTVNIRICAKRWGVVVPCIMNSWKWWSVWKTRERLSLSVR